MKKREELLNILIELDIYLKNNFNKSFFEKVDLITFVDLIKTYFNYEADNYEIPIKMAMMIYDIEINDEIFYLHLPKINLYLKKIINLIKEN